MDSSSLIPLVLFLISVMGGTIWFLYYVNRDDFPPNRYTASYWGVYEGSAPHEMPALPPLAIYRSLEAIAPGSESTVPSL
jgi:hypothetical protein